METLSHLSALRIAASSNQVAPEFTKRLSTRRSLAKAGHSTFTAVVRRGDGALANGALKHQGQVMASSEIHGRLNGVMQA